MNRSLNNPTQRSKVPDFKELCRNYVLTVHKLVCVDSLHETTVIERRQNFLLTELQKTLEILATIEGGKFIAVESAAEGQVEEILKTIITLKLYHQEMFQEDAACDFLTLVALSESDDLHQWTKDQFSQYPY